MLDRLLVTCSSDRLADIASAASAPSDPDIADLALLRYPAWAPKASVPGEAGRVLLVGASGEWLELGAPVLRAIDCRKAVEE
jgi:hypothetical protein